MQCNICENTIPAFIGLEKTCPVCNCRPVHRALIKKFGKDIIKDNNRVLHVGPHVALVRKLEKAMEAFAGSAYIPIDPKPGKNTIVPVDISDIGINIDNVDIVIAIDVLDEIRDENKAMENIVANMQTGATLLFSVPLKSGKTDRGYDTEAENSHAQAKTKTKNQVKVLNEGDRTDRYGGNSKFRKYGDDDILDFINGYGFNAKKTKINKDKDLGIEEVTIIEATKQ